MERAFLRVFKTVHMALTPQACVQSVWEATRIVSLTAWQIDSGTTHMPLSQLESTDNFSCARPTNPFASTGSTPMAARVDFMTSTTFVQAALESPTMHNNALEHRQLQPITPYDFNVWDNALRRYNLYSKYPTVSAGL